MNKINQSSYVKLGKRKIVLQIPAIGAPYDEVVRDQITSQKNKKKNTSFQ